MSFSIVVAMIAHVARLVLIASAALAVSACGGDEPQGREQMRVVATTTQAADFARHVGGNRAVVHGLLPANADPHDFDVRPSDVRALADADVVVRSGGELDEWLGGAIDSAGGDAPVVELMAEVDVTGDDPHWWQDPVAVADAVPALVEAFKAQDPDGAAEYERNGRRYIDSLRELDRTVRRCLRPMPAADRRLVTTHDAIGAYADRYGLEIVGTVIPSQSSHAQASAGDTAALVRTIREQDVPAVFPDQGADARLERAIAEQSGARLGPALWTDSLGGAGSEAPTYIDAIMANTEAIATGITGEPVSCSPGG